MDPPAARIFTPARIVALALIALAVLALAYLRSAPDAGAVSVPRGAHAGELILKPCSYATENGSYPADCGTLVVPENRAGPQSRLIALPVTRIRARAAHPGVPVFCLQGGPGITNMEFRQASRLAGQHDVVLVGRLWIPEEVAGFGHTGTIWYSQSRAGSWLINTFFDSGRIDESLYQPGKADFTPGFTLAALAEIIAGSMAGLALLTVLSLLWMARRVRKRGRFGPKASATLRPACPLVFGLGGWFLGALIVLTTMPGVPLDDELLAAISAGVPAGLGVYLAWVNRDWSATTKTTGFAAAAGGALVGAWLGFHATAGLFAVITAIAGAAAGANLLLLALDITWDRQARDRFTDTNAKKTP